MAELKNRKIIKECEETGEPYFVLRAKDILSNFAIRAYEQVVQDYAPHDDQFITNLDEIQGEWKEWQRNNPTALRYPD